MVKYSACSAPGLSSLYTLLTALFFQLRDQRQCKEGVGQREREEEAKGPDRVVLLSCKDEVQVKTESREVTWKNGSWVGAPTCCAS